MENREDEDSKGDRGDEVLRIEITWNQNATLKSLLIGINAFIASYSSICEETYKLEESF